LDAGSCRLEGKGRGKLKVKGFCLETRESALTVPEKFSASKTDKVSWVKKEKGGGRNRIAELELQQKV